MLVAAGQLQRPGRYAPQPVPRLRRATAAGFSRRRHRGRRTPSGTTTAGGTTASTGQVSDPQRGQYLPARAPRQAGSYRPGVYRGPGPPAPRINRLTLAWRLPDHPGRLSRCPGSIPEGWRHCSCLPARHVRRRYRSGRCMSFPKFAGTMSPVSPTCFLQGIEADGLGEIPGLMPSRSVADGDLVLRGGVRWNCGTHQPHAHHPQLAIVRFISSVPP